jgi:hypothetical protein
MATQSLSKTQPYFWEEVYKTAVLEPDNELFEERIQVAEEVLLTRWLELTSQHEHRAEIQAIMDAFIALRNLKREWLLKRRV